MPRASEPSVATPSHAQVLAAVRQIVGEQIGLAADQVGEQAELIADLGCDSLDMVEIAMEVEDEFNIQIPDEVQESIRTVADIVAGVIRLLGER